MATDDADPTRTRGGGARVRLPRPWSGLVTALDQAMAPFWNLWPLYLVLIATAVFAGVWGFTDFYGDQYGRVPWYAWPFVPDSPLSTTSWIVASLLLKAGVDRMRNPVGAAATLFAHWSAMMNIKVGLWTVFVLLYFYDHFFTGSAAHVRQEWMLVVAHFGMVVFAVMLMRKMAPLTGMGYVAILALGFLWDFMDYFFVSFFLPGSGITIFPNGVPTDPEPIRRVVAPISVLLTLIATGSIALFLRLRGPPVER